MDKYEEYEKINAELEMATRKIMEDMHKKSLMNKFEDESLKEDSTLSGSINQTSSHKSDDYELKTQQKQAFRNEAITTPLNRSIEKLKDDCNKYVRQISQLKDERKQLIDDRRKILKDFTKTVSEKQQLENSISKLTLSVQQKNQELAIMKKDMANLSKRLKDKRSNSTIHLKDKRGMSCNCILVHEKDSLEKTEKELTKQDRMDLATMAMTTNNYNSTLLGCLKLQSKIIDNLKRQIKVQDDLARVSLKDEELIFVTNQGNHG